LGEISLKFESFNWEVKEIDGHNHNQIANSLIPQLSSKPLFLLAHTIKGKGFSAMENNPEWHHKAPNKEEIKTFFPYKVIEVESEVSKSVNKLRSNWVHYALLAGLILDIIVRLAR
jgi:transketolase